VSQAIEEVARSLVLQLADDAEGANHVMLVEVTGAPTEHDAQIVAKAIANSPLVKTAMFGGDPNPGRILQAIGSSGANFLPQSVASFIGDVLVIEGGQIPDEYREAGVEAARAALGEREIVVAVSLGQGAGSSRAPRVGHAVENHRINAEYTTRAARSRRRPASAPSRRHARCSRRSRSSRSTAVRPSWPRSAAPSCGMRS
jgi:glutamate N-acetyltransferase/amino-acid N-acetyltransferase